MLYEDPEQAAKAVTIAFDFMEWTWRDEEGRSFRPREEDILDMYMALKDSLLSDEGRHDFIKAHGLMVDITDAGTVIYRMTPEREQSYRLAFAKDRGAPFETLGKPSEDKEDDIGW